MCVFLTRVYCVVAFSWLLKISPAYEHLGICWPRVALAATSLNLGGDVTRPGSQLPELPELPQAPQAVTGPGAWCSLDKHLTGCQVLDNGEKIADLTLTRATNTTNYVLVSFRWVRPSWASSGQSGEGKCYV